MHGDLYQFIHKAFNKSENFSKTLYELVIDQLELMLLPKTEEEWELMYRQASLILDKYPRGKGFDEIMIILTNILGIMLNQLIDTPMHLLFQGIDKSVTEFSYALLARY